MREENKRWLKRSLKNKVRITAGVIIGFMITGGLSFAEKITVEELEHKENSIEFAKSPYDATDKQKWNHKLFTITNGKHPGKVYLNYSKLVCDSKAVCEKKEFKKFDSLDLSELKRIDETILVQEGYCYSIPIKDELILKDLTINGDLNLSGLKEINSVEDLKKKYAESDYVEKNTMNYEQYKKDKAENFGKIMRSENDMSINNNTVSGNIVIGVEELDRRLDLSNNKVGGKINLDKLTSAASMNNSFENTEAGKVDLSNLKTIKNAKKTFLNSKIKEIDMSKLDISLADGYVDLSMMLDNAESDKVSFGKITNENVYKAEGEDNNTLGDISKIKDFNFIYNDVNGESILDLIEYKEKKYFVVPYDKYVNNSWKSENNANLRENNYAKLNPYAFNNRLYDRIYYKNQYESGKEKLIEDTRYIILESPLYEDKRKVTVQDLIDMGKLIGINLNEDHTGLKLDPKAAAGKLSEGADINNPKGILVTDTKVKEALENISSGGSNSKSIENNKAGIANAMAVANIPQVSADKLLSIGVGAGYYNKQGAIAVGISGQDRGKNVVFKVSSGVDFKGNFSVGAGINYSFMENKKEVNNINPDLRKTIEKQDEKTKKAIEEALAKQEKRHRKEMQQLIYQFKNGDINNYNPGYEIYSVLGFRFDKFNLTNELVMQLNSILSKANISSDSKIEVIGFTDLNGSDKYNLKLGLNRAMSVKKYLISMGVPSDIIEIKSRGINEINGLESVKLRRVDIIIK
ncbi:outer membrane protein A [Oceanivirga miroungae]|uniref:Outer membrane protein A n=2 Tax=Oceanivirga miroungae TaxID=1130046 RepID=A0A6I8MCY0_9FUSO|nr:outer membrane protein A [Oceanivirga miroungae]